MLKLVPLIFRYIHTLKGNARFYGLSQMANAARNADVRLAEMRKQNSWTVPEIETVLSSLEDILDRYKAIYTRTLRDITLSHSTESISKKVAAAIEDTIQNLNNALRSHDLNLFPDVVRESVRNLEACIFCRLDSVLGDLLANLGQLADELGKTKPKIAIKDHGVGFKNSACPILRDTFTHLFRNSLDHGIEDQDNRRMHHKPENGLITFEIDIKNEFLRILFWDDGGGFDLAKIYQKSVAAGIIDKEANPTRSEVAESIFLPGLSTRDKATDISGFGVGLDAVKTLLEKTGGRIVLQITNPTGHELAPTPGRFVIDIPAEAVQAVKLNPN